ncbi:MAG: 50S ribosomal protein L10 [Chlamydiae bacterium]|nr:50S ribosomal protein L10 [Chlamydiota bacterium]
MRPEKQLLLDEIEGQIKQNGSFVIMSYFGLDANTVTDFRHTIAELGGDVEVTRKRILIKAAQTAGIELDINTLPGHISLVFTGEDAVQTVKAVFKLRKDTDKAVEVLGGRFDGQLLNGEEVEKLSKLPGKNEMRAQLLSVFEAPMSQTVAVMESLLCSVLHCLENKSKEESSN